MFLKAAGVRLTTEERENLSDGYNPREELKMLSSKAVAMRLPSFECLGLMAVSMQEEGLIDEVETDWNVA